MKEFLEDLSALKFLGLTFTYSPKFDFMFFLIVSLFIKCPLLSYLIFVKQQLVWGWTFSTNSPFVIRYRIKALLISSWLSHTLKDRRFDFIFSSFILRNSLLIYLVDRIISLFHRWIKSIGFSFLLHMRSNGRNQPFHSEAQYLSVNIQINLSFIYYLWLFKEYSHRRWAFVGITIYYWLFRFKIYRNWSTFFGDG